MKGGGLPLLIILVLSSCEVYDVYRGDHVKKSEAITYRTDAALKNALLKPAGNIV